MFDGPIIPVTVKIGTPMAIGGLLQFCYALVDTMFIARIDPKSTAILAGTGLMFPLFFLFMAVAASMSTGIGVQVGRFVGANDRERAALVMPSGVLIALCIGGPALVGGALFPQHFIHLLAGNKLSEEAIAYGLRFFMWLLPGFTLMLFLNVFMGIMQGEGRTSTIARAMVLSTVLNIALDPLFIFGLQMGVAGAGLATTLSILSAAIYLCVGFLRNKSSFPFSFNIFRSDAAIVKETIHIGFPQFLSMAAMAISVLVFNKIVGTIGQTPMNAWALAGRMDQILFIPIFAVSGATMTMIAQNIGRKNFSRLRAIYRTNVIFAVALVSALAALYMLSAPLFFRIFSDVKEVVALSALQVRCVSWTFVGVAAVIVSASTFQAIGKPGAALWLAVVRMGLISIPLALVLVYVFHLRMWGMYIAMGTGNLIILPLALLWTRYHLKKLPSGSMPS